MIYEESFLYLLYSSESIHRFLVWIFFPPRLLDFFNHSLTFGIKRRRKWNLNLLFIEIFHGVIKAQLD